MSVVDRLTVLYEVNDQQAQAAYKRMETTSKASTASVVQNAKRAEDAFKRQTNSMRGDLGNIAAQFNDIGVTAAMGMNPMLIALQQGTQLSQVFAGQSLRGAITGLGGAFASIISPVSLATLGITAVAAVAVQAGMSFLSFGKDADKLSDRIKAMTSALSDYQSAAADATASTSDLAEKYGVSTRAAQELLGIIMQIARVNAAESIKKGMDGLSDTFDGLVSQVERYDELVNRGDGEEIAALKAVRRLKTEFGLTVEEAQELTRLLRNQERATTLDQQAAAAQEVARFLGDAAEQANYQNTALNEGSKAAAKMALGALEIKETTWDAETAARDLSAAVGGISFGAAINGADDLASRIGGMIGQARALMSALGQAQLGNLGAKDRQELVEAERDLVTAGKDRVEVEGELAAIRKRQELGTAGEGVPFLQNMRDKIIEDARDTAAATAAAQEQTDAYYKAVADADREAAKASKGGKKGGKGRTAREERPFFENIEKDLLNLERQMQLIGKTSEEVATMQSRWELLDEAKKRGVAVNETLNAQIDAQAAQVGRLTGELERAEISQQQFDQAIDGVADAMAGALVAGESLRDGLAQVFAQIASDILNSGIRNALSGQFGGGGLFNNVLGAFRRANDPLGQALNAIPGFGGFRAAGGPVSPDKWNIVGENGPEIFVPSSAGTIIPNHKLGGGGMSYSPVFNIGGNVTADDLAAVRQEAAQGFAQMQRSLPSRVQTINRDPLRR